MVTKSCYDIEPVLPSQSIDHHENQAVKGRGGCRAVFGEVTGLRQAGKKWFIREEARSESEDGEGY